MKQWVVFVRRQTAIHYYINNTHHFVENRRIVVLVLDGHFDGAHVVQVRVPVVRGSYRQVHFFVPGGFVSVKRLRGVRKKNGIHRVIGKKKKNRDFTYSYGRGVLTSRVVISPVCASMENLERSLGPLTNVYVMVPPLSGGSLSNALTYNKKMICLADTKTHRQDIFV